MLIMSINSIKWQPNRKMKGMEFILLGIRALAGAFLRYKMVSTPIILGALPLNILLFNIIGMLYHWSILDSICNLKSRR